MRSRLYTGKVMHARSKPVPHKFSYPVYFYRFDLDELDSLDKKVLGFGHNRIRPVALHDRDYLMPGNGSLREKLKAILDRAGHVADIGRVDLVTSARVMHYVFNPVSFFFCSGPQGDLDCVVVQVNNTFGEMHAYVLTGALSRRRPDESHYRAEKVFHVSPYFDRKGSYEFYFTDMSSDKLDIILQHKEDEEVVFAARLTGSPRPLDRWTVAGKLLRHPLTASLTMPRIMWQAARLRFLRHLPVYHKPPPASPMTIRAAPPGPIARLGRKVTRVFLSRIDTGQLTVVYPEGDREHFGSEPLNRAEIRIVDNAFFRRTLFHGGIGFGESYVGGEWSTDDLPATLTLLCENLQHLEEKHHRFSALGRTFEHTRHLLKANTLAGSRRNISSHYDLSNRFFSLFLDRTMTYSCGLYPEPDTGLEEAQRHKIKSIMDKARINEGDSVLEIGCGWGGFAIEAARSTRCRVTGITISGEQLKLARERVAAADLQDLVTLELLDYRDIEGTYDRVVSIEMLEAVGHDNLATWFNVCSKALKPGGRAVIQVITIPHERYGKYKRSSDWIRKHIFPGGHLPSWEALDKTIRRNTDLVIKDVERIGPHYARTLADWDHNLTAFHEKALAQGFDEAFLRKWHYYFAYCMAGFKTGAIDNLQIVLDKPGTEIRA